MGFNTTVLILNDRLSEIESGAKEFAKNLSLEAGGGWHSGPHPYDFHRSQSGIIETHHADGTSVILVGGNTATVVGYSSGYQHHKAEHQVRILKDMLAKFGIETRKMSGDRPEMALKHAEQAVERALLADPTHGGLRSAEYRRYRSWQREVQFFQDRVAFIRALMEDE